MCTPPSLKGMLEGKIETLDTVSTQPTSQEEVVCILTDAVLQSQTDLTTAVENLTRQVHEINEGCIIRTYTEKVYIVSGLFIDSACSGSGHVLWHNVTRYRSALTLIIQHNLRVYFKITPQNKVKSFEIKINKIVDCQCNIQH